MLLIYTGFVTFPTCKNLGHNSGFAISIGIRLGVQFVHQTGLLPSGVGG